MYTERKNILNQSCALVVSEFFESTRLRQGGMITMDAFELTTICLGMWSLLWRGAYDQNNRLGQTNQLCCCWIVRRICYTMLQLSALWNIHWCCLQMYTWGRLNEGGGVAFSQMKNSRKTPLIVQHLENIWARELGPGPDNMHHWDVQYILDRLSLKNSSVSRTHSCILWRFIPSPSPKDPCPPLLILKEHF